MRQFLLSVAGGLAIAATLMGTAPTADAGMVYTEGQQARLSDLINGGVIEVGDKTFSGFVYNPNLNAPSADEVSVTGFINNGGDIGILFSGPFSVAGSPFAGPAELDAGVQFDVTIDPDAGMVFDAVDLTATIEALGPPLVFGDGSIGETITTPGPGGAPVPVGTISVERLIIDGEELTNIPSGSTGTIEPDLTQITVLKDLFLDVSPNPAIAQPDQDDRLRLTSFTQVFRQRPVIPEPAAFTMVVVGLLSASLGRRRRDA